MVGIHRNDIVFVEYDDVINKKKALNEEYVKLAEILSN
jgi:cell division protein FtsL